MQTILDSEENLYSSDLNRSIKLDKSLNNLERSFSDLSLKSNLNGSNLVLSNLLMIDNQKAPKIIRDLNSDYKSSEPFSLRLIVQGDNLKIEWYHDAIKIEPTVNQIEFIQLDAFHTYELSFNFSHPLPSDSGFYYCQISNQYGTAVSSTTLVQISDVEDEFEQIDESIFQSKPIFIEYFFDICVEKQSEAVFKCKIIGKPDPIITWSFGSVKINNSSKYELINDSNHYKLFIKDINIKDQGEYTCYAKNIKGDASWSANLYFNKEIISKSNEISKLANNFLDKLNGDDVKLSLDNIMNEDYYSKMKQLENNSIKDLIQNLTACQEKINHLETNLNDEDLKKRLKDTNGLSNNFQEINADNDNDETTKELLRNMPKIIEDLKAEQLIYKTIEPFSITLIAQGDGLIIEWFKDNERVIPLINQIEFIKLDQPKTYELVFNFNSPLVSDSGVYHCSIGNKFGSLLSAKVNIRIIDPDIEKHFLETNKKSLEDRSKSKRRVRFSLPRDSDVFLIPFHKTPIPTAPGQPSISEFKSTSLLLSWSPSHSDLTHYDEDDRDIDNQSNLSYLIEYTTNNTNVWAVFASNIDRCSTYVDNLNSNITYSFRIRAENQIGVSDVSPSISTDNYFLNGITEKASIPELNHIIHSRFRREFISFDLDQPTATDEQKDIHYYVSGQTAEASMLVFGYPIPKVEWMRYKKVLKADDKKYKMHSDRFSYYHLEILHANDQDEGLYQLVATNENGKVCIHDIYLYQADSPVFLQTYNDMKVKSYQDVNLTCRIDGLPAPEIKFFKDKLRLVESNRIKIKHTKPDVWTIQIQKAFVSDSGLYSCVVKNMAGEAMCSCNLVIEQDNIMPYSEARNVYSSSRARAESVDYMIKEEEERKNENDRKSKEPDFDEIQEEDFDLDEDPFLLPVVDSSLLVRIREYKRGFNYENDIDNYNNNDSTNDNNDSNSGKKWGSFAIKENAKPNENQRAGSLSKEINPSNENNMKHFESFDRLNSNEILKEEQRSNSDESFNKTDNESDFKRSNEFKVDYKTKLGKNKNSIRDSLEALKASLNKNNETNKPQKKQQPQPEQVKIVETKSKQQITEKSQNEINKINLSDKPSGLFIKISENEPAKPFLTEAQQKLKLQQELEKKQQEQLLKEKNLPGKLDISLYEQNLDKNKDTLTISKKEKSNLDEKVSWPFYSFDKSERLAPIIREKLKDVFLFVGKTVTLECKIEGNPEPRIFWYHENQIIRGNDGRITTSKTLDGKLILTIENATKNDLGSYRCTAMNRYGITVATSKIVSAKVPDRPTKPIVYQNSDVSALVVWQLPPYNDNSGNANILGFKIDFKKADDFRWTTALYTTDERCLVINLIPLTKYRFRVSCINSFGFSQYSWASEECETLAFGHSNITIENKLFEKLLNNRYDLLKNGEQYILVKKPFEEPKSIIKKQDERKEEIKKSDPIKIKPLVKTESVKNLKIIEETIEHNENNDSVDTNESTSSNDSLNKSEFVLEPSESLLEKFRRSVQKVKDQTRGPKGNAFEKFKSAYIAGAQAPDKPVEKSKYLQLY